MQRTVPSERDIMVRNANLKKYVYDFGDHFPQVRGLIMPPSAYLIAWAEYLNSLLPIVNNLPVFKDKLSETGLAFTEEEV